MALHASLSLFRVAGRNQRKRNKAMNRGNRGDRWRIWGLSKWILKMQSSLLICGSVRAGAAAGGGSKGILDFSIDDPVCV